MMKKIFGILFVVLLLVGVGAWYFVSFRLDAMIRDHIETTASASLGTQVSVGGVNTDIKGGSLTISSITIANPPGFNNKNAFSLNGIEAAVDYANFDIKRVVIDKPDIVIEEKGGRTNFDQILAGMEKQQSEPDPEPGDAGKEEPVIVIRHFRMNESRASFESESLDKYSDLKVQAIEMSDLKGTPSEISKAVTTEIIKEITQQAAIEFLKAKASDKISDIFGKKKD